MHTYASPRAIPVDARRQPVLSQVRRLRGRTLPDRRTAQDLHCTHATRANVARERARGRNGEQQRSGWQQEQSARAIRQPVSGRKERQHTRGPVSRVCSCCGKPWWTLRRGAVWLLGRAGLVSREMRQPAYGRARMRVHATAARSTRVIAASCLAAPPTGHCSAQRSRLRRPSVPGSPRVARQPCTAVRTNRRTQRAESRRDMATWRLRQQPQAPACQCSQPLSQL